MRLIGENIYLGAFEPVLTHFQNWLEDEEVVRYGGFVKTMPQTIEHIKEYTNKLLNNPNIRLFGIYKDEKYIGNIRLDIEWIWHVGTISILIGDKTQWGNGYGTEAINLITEFGFNTLGLHRIDAGILEGNEGSIKAFQKAGFEIEGRQKHKRFNMGEYVDVILVGKIQHVKSQLKGKENIISQIPGQFTEYPKNVPPLGSDAFSKWMGYGQ